MEWFSKVMEINSLLIALGFGSIVAIGRGIKKSREDAKAQAKAVHEATEARFRNLEYANVAILHDKIYKQCTEFMKAGWISVDDLENLEYLWRSYHNLGGNGTGETLYKKVLNLPNTESEGN